MCTLWCANRTNAIKPFFFKFLYLYISDLPLEVDDKMLGNEMLHQHFVLLLIW